MAIVNVLTKLRYPTDENVQPLDIGKSGSFLEYTFDDEAKTVVKEIKKDE